MAPFPDSFLVSTGFSILSPLHWTELSLGVFKETAGLASGLREDDHRNRPCRGGGQPNTLAHYRSELSRAQLAVRCHRRKWEAKGTRSFEESVRQRLETTLAEEPKSYLDDRQEAELQRIEEIGRAMVGPP